MNNLLLRDNISCTTRLTELYIQQCKFGPYALKSLANCCPNLVMLRLDTCPRITDVDITNLVRHCTNLVGLYEVQLFLIWLGI